MDVGWIGLGKLGLPIALVLANKGHRVHGYDINPAIRDFISFGDPSGLNYIEPGLADMDISNFSLCPEVAHVVENSEVVFVAVQTPHAPAYGGEVPAPRETRDFDYAYLEQAVRDVCRVAYSKQRDIVLVVVSTVLPGTTNRILRRHLNPYVKLVYSPQFIAMGTTIDDFAKPEFWLIGQDGEWPDAGQKVLEVYKAVGQAPVVLTTIATAEMIKVAYNTFISMKIVWANHVAELCDATGADMDGVIGAMELSRDRIISTKYMRPGMGDGGACHPRDLIALSHLESRAGAPYLFQTLAQIREAQAEGLAWEVADYASPDQPVVLLGYTYKPNTPLTDGSPALLVKWFLENKFKLQVDAVDPRHNPDWGRVLGRRAVFLIGTDHLEFREVLFPPGSVVIDPWGTHKLGQDNIILIRPGRR